MTNFNNMGYRWLTPEGLQFLQADYLLPGQTVDERVDIICNRAEELLGIPGFAARFKANLKKGWYSLSSPIWSNFGTDRGLPISCFGTYIEDNMESILEAISEIGMMTKHGGGTSAGFSALRPRGAEITNNGKSSGAVHFMVPFDSLITTVSQGSTRRGNKAAYLNLSHPDAREFLRLKSEGNPIQNLSFGVMISDALMEGVLDGDPEKEELLAKVIETRANIGYPYIVFEDTVNRDTPYTRLPEWNKINDAHWFGRELPDWSYLDGTKRPKSIGQSNLCSEIALPNGPTESFVCDLSSMNVLHFDEWKDTDAVELLVFFLDAVMSEFIGKAGKIKYLDRPVRFAEKHRAIGVGWLGYHSYLQSKMIPFESLDAKFINREVAESIQSEAEAATHKLAILFGEPEYCKGSGRRNTTVTAIAPTKSSAFIMGQVSEGIEPHQANFYIKALAKGTFPVKNPHLEALLEELGQNTEEVWESIKEKAGSVQHLSFLSDHEKLVFKTFQEISPKEIIIQAAMRQKYIDQSQSLNLMIHPLTDPSDVNALLFLAWKMGVKSLYYSKSVNAAQEFARDIMECVSCAA